MYNAMGVGADLAQAGLEWAGHKEVGKAVGVTGNITADNYPARACARG